MTEPTEKAIALQYEQGVDLAPKITATGKGEIAKQIIELAKHYGIVIREDAELVDILSLLEINSVIPVEAYAAIAEILSYVYKQNDRLGRECDETK